MHKQGLDKPAMAFCQNCKFVTFQTVCGDRYKPGLFATLKCNGCGEINYFGAEKTHLGVGLKHYPPPEDVQLNYKTFKKIMKRLEL